MIGFMAAAMFVYIAIVLSRDIKRVGLPAIMFSPFWVVTVFWYIGFPLRAYLISNNLIEIQAAMYQDQISSDYLFTALLLSFVYWLVVRFGYTSITDKSLSDYNIGLMGTKINRRSLYIVRVIALLSLVAAIIFMGDNLFVGDEYIGYSGNEQNEARTGNGLKFLMSVFYTFSAYSLLGYYLIKKESPRVLDLTIILLFMGLGLFLSNALSSRRVAIEIPTLVFLVYAYLYHGVRKYWPPIGFILVFVIMPIAHVYRYHDFQEGGLVDFIDALFYYLSDFEFYITNISSTSEGVDHFSQLLLRMDWVELVSGVDHGLSWIYSFGLSLVPRALWVSKPEIYGLISQQYFLYPNMYHYGAATTTFPPSFIVDFSYGFGLIFALVLYYILGRCLIVIERLLTSPSYSGLLVVVGIYVVLNAFNIFRGGLSFITTVWLFLIPVSISFGVRNLVRELWQFISLVFGISAVSRHPYSMQKIGLFRRGTNHGD